MPQNPCPATAKSGQRIGPAGIRASSRTCHECRDLSAGSWHRDPTRNHKVGVTLHLSAQLTVLPRTTCQPEPRTSRSSGARSQHPLLFAQDIQSENTPNPFSLGAATHPPHISWDHHSSPHMLVPLCVAPCPITRAGRDPAFQQESPRLRTSNY